MPRAMLVGGCSSGIGATMNSELHRRGQRVYATARRPESLAPFGIRVVMIQPGATPAREFVVPVVDKLLSAAPPANIRGGKNSTRLPLLKKLLPLCTFDRMASRVFIRPGGRDIRRHHAINNHPHQRAIAG